MKKILTSLLCLVLSGSILLSGCSPSRSAVSNTPNQQTSGSTPVSSDSEKADNFISSASSGDDTWAIYWYLCGSDLETLGGLASADVAEMLSVTLPDNVKVVIEAGGAMDWKNSKFLAGSLGRYLYSGNELELISQEPGANMGEAETLADFLEFCTQNYPADHTMVLFWNHGGGSAQGVCFDELYDYDSLTLSEMYSAFIDVYEPSLEEPPIDIIAFDACLMATIDTAYAFCDIAEYLLASEEQSPGLGWDYAGWFQTLANNPDISAEELGITICDTYMEACEYAYVADEITMSLTDLSLVPELIYAYDNLGGEALANASEDPYFYAEFSRAAYYSENYGGNTDEEGYSNMVDLGDLVKNSLDLFPYTGQDVLDALEQCVVYQVNGPYRQQANGLSCYYSYSGDADDFIAYMENAASPLFTSFYIYGLTGELDENGQAYLEQLGYGGDLYDTPDISSYGLDDYPLYVNDDGQAILDIGSDAANLLNGVYMNLFYVSEEDDIILALGRDNDILSDWENGMFADNFRGVWGSLDGHFCYMDLTYEGYDYNIYSIPILLNGAEYNLHVAYDFNAGEYSILGARMGLSDEGMSDKNLIQLQSGDEITTIHYAMTLTGPDDELTPFEAETFTVTENTAFYEVPTGDGYFAMMFEMVDIYNNTYLSDMALFTVEGDYIYTSTY